MNEYFSLDASRVQLYKDVDKPADEKYREEQHREENTSCNLSAILASRILREQTLLKVVVPLASSDEDRRPDEKRHDDKRENNLKRSCASYTCNQHTSCAIAGTRSSLC